MEKNTKEINDEEPVSIIDENYYKYPSCEFPRNKVMNYESNDYTRFNSVRREGIKKVTFNNNVTIVNIQSHKNLVKNQNFLNEIIEEDFKEEKEKKKKCVNCNIF